MRKYYEDLINDYINVGCPWTYIWNYEKKEYGLDFRFDKDKKVYYELYIDNVFLKRFDSINDALDNIMIGEKTLRYLLINTDFKFDSIL